MIDFTPPRLLRNRHIQSIFASTGPRKRLVRRRAKALLDSAQSHILECDDGVRLQGEYSAQKAGSKGLVIMIHGWEGCSDSLYLLSAGGALYDAGFDIFRLNLRDHGPTLHLNRELFNFTMLREVVEAVKQIQTLFPHKENYLAGFSLGGNFSLRVAANATANGIQLNQVVAVCPVINPLKTMDNLDQGWFVYHDYFRNKWKRSLMKKLQHFPELDYGEILPDLKTLTELNDYFVPNHTGYDDPVSYFAGYAIGGNVLAELDIPCRIISTEDDPVISVNDLRELPDTPYLQVELSRYGGHCGFIKNYRLDSWIDQRLLTLFSGAVHRIE